VAVKVQYAHLQKQAVGDIKVLRAFTDLGAYLFKDFQYQWLAEEVESNLPQELDFLLEIRSAERARELLKDMQFIKIPTNYPQFSSRQVITMEFIDGIQISDTRRLRAECFDLALISSTISKAFCQLIFIDGFIHSDPHSGNLLVRRSKVGLLEVVLLDHGLYKTLDQFTRLSYAKLWKGLILRVSRSH